MISPASVSINSSIGGVPVRKSFFLRFSFDESKTFQRVIGTVPPAVPSIIPTSVSSTMIISSLHDQAFFICKEFLMTERTYKKDLEVVAEHFRRDFIAILHQQIDQSIDEEQFQQENEALRNLSDLLFTNLVPIHHFHSQYLRHLEQRISLWFELD